MYTKPTSFDPIRPPPASTSSLNSGRLDWRMAVVNKDSYNKLRITPPIAKGAKWAGTSLSAKATGKHHDSSWYARCFFAMQTKSLGNANATGFAYINTRNVGKSISRRLVDQASPLEKGFQHCCRDSWPCFQEQEWGIHWSSRKCKSYEHLKAKRLAFQ